MLKISRSSMHEQYVVTFFHGDNIAKSGPYMYEESLPLFAEENLGPNLIEYDLQENALNLEENLEIKNLIDDLKSSSTNRIDILDVTLSDLSKNFDLEIEYSDQFFNSINYETFSYPLENLGRFKVDFRRVKVADMGRILGIDEDKMSYIRVKVSRDFLKRRGSNLSDFLHTSFNPKRYVDTQIVFFLMMTSLSGISSSRARRKSENIC